MNQRRDERFSVEQPVDVLVFGSTDIQMQAKIRNASGRGMGLHFEQRLAPGTALKISLPDSLLLGEVIYCRADGDGWYVGVELAHGLFGLRELAEVMRGFSEEPSGREHPETLHHAGRQRNQ